MKQHNTRPSHVSRAKQWWPTTGARASETRSAAYSSRARARHRPKDPKRPQPRPRRQQWPRAARVHNQHRLWFSVVIARARARVVIVHVGNHNSAFFQIFRQKNKKKKNVVGRSYCCCCCYNNHFSFIVHRESAAYSLGAWNPYPLQWERSRSKKDAETTQNRHGTDHYPMIARRGGATQ